MREGEHLSEWPWAVPSRPERAGQRRSRVMYIDGKLPIETFKERMELVAALYGQDIEFYGYNRDDLDDGQMPPLNIEDGQKWLRREIEAINPDLIFFDSIMSLLMEHHVRGRVPDTCIGCNLAR
jgi:hypothetical protein